MERERLQWRLCMAQLRKALKQLRPCSLFSAHQASTSIWPQEARVVLRSPSHWRKAVAYLICSAAKRREVPHGCGQFADAALYVPASGPAQDGATAEPPLGAELREDVDAEVLAQRDEDPVLRVGHEGNATLFWLAEVEGVGKY
ncbi:hypothetical protein [Streptomyces microflavus]|uniref:hypothetical protein n=1 Tax=Streptomyces microflavus TaxID=1919 RepID=UPI00340E0A96